MKIRKTRQQRNFRIDKDFYTRTQLEDMERTDEAVFKLVTWEADLRVSCEYLDRVDFILEDGFYYPVAYGKNGNIYHIKA